MGPMCRAMKDCISCLSLHAKQCIWQSAMNSQFPCRAGFFDVETSDHVTLLTHSNQCKIINSNTDSYKQQETFEGSLITIIGIAVTILALCTIIWYIMYLKLRGGRVSWNSIYDQREEIELLPYAKREVDDIGMQTGFRYCGLKSTCE